METTYSKSVDGHNDVLPRIVERVRQFDQRVVTTTRERPLLAVGVALLIGYLLGRFASRLG